jgi:hypothetical protein
LVHCFSVLVHLNKDLKAAHEHLNHGNITASKKDVNPGILEEYFFASVLVRINQAKHAHIYVVRSIKVREHLGYDRAHKLYAELNYQNYLHRADQKEILGYVVGTFSSH